MLHDLPPYSTVYKAATTRQKKADATLRRFPASGTRTQQGVVYGFNGGHQEQR